ncbi:MAG: hypothetical protein JNK76_08195 [Planctomycetales bacterium]|nr:hypothetical protein [Planctomycetales bacterium]
MQPDLSAREQLLMEIANETLIQYYRRACGSAYFNLILGAGIFAFILAFVVVRYGKGATVGPGLVLTSLLPLVLGLLSTAEGIVVVSRIVEQSGTDPESGVMLTSFGQSFCGILFGAMCALPALITAIIGAVIRALSTKTQVT